MKRMLINAKQPEELRVALVDGQDLVDVDIETPSRAQKKSNIYKARVVRVEPSLDAAFVEYGGGRHGFLPLKEVAREYFRDGADGEGRQSIQGALRNGQELVVQVEKEERGNKGAALTTFISLAGRYLVLMPNNPGAGGISRRVEGEERSELREALSGLELPSGFGLIVRTAGVGRSARELQADVDYLRQVWEAVRKAADERPAPFLVYRESNIVIRALRDYFRDDIQEILVDTPEVYEQASEFMALVMPDSAHRLKLYQDRVPLFSRYQIESRIEAAFDHTMRLPSGGSLVIDHTEALVSIDINSARATRGSDIEQTALQTNLEAADEIARQLRVRDIGGLIVIDFIDMTPARHQREVENRLREALESDRARIQTGRISRFGLLEMSRQRLRPSLGESSYQACPRCDGRGYVRNVESLALSILRVLAGEAMKDRTSRIVVNLPVEAATYLLNEKRATLREIEERSHVDLRIVPDPGKMSPEYAIERVRTDDVGHPSNRKASYDLVTPPEPDAAAAASAARTAPESEPAVRHLPPPAAQPKAAEGRKKKGAGEKPGLVRRLLAPLLGGEAAEDGTPESGETERGAADAAPASGAASSSSSSSRRRRGRGGRGRGGRRASESGRQEGGRRPPERTDDGAGGGAQQAPSGAAGASASSSRRRGGARRADAGHAAAGDGGGGARRRPAESQPLPAVQRTISGPLGDPGQGSGTSPAPGTDGDRSHAERRPPPSSRDDGAEPREGRETAGAPTAEGSAGSPEGGEKKPRTRRGRRGGRRRRSAAAAAQAAGEASTEASAAPVPSMGEARSASSTREPHATPFMGGASSVPSGSGAPASPSMRETSAAPSQEETDAVPFGGGTAAAPPVRETHPVPSMGETSAASSGSEPSAMPPAREAPAAPFAGETHTAPSVREEPAAPFSREASTAPATGEASAPQAPPPEPFPPPVSPPEPAPPPREPAFTPGEPREPEHGFPPPSPPPPAPPPASGAPSPDRVPPPVSEVPPGAPVAPSPERAPHDAPDADGDTGGDSRKVREPLP